MSAVLSVTSWASNGELLAGIAQLGYLDPGTDRVLDVTFGRGKWWTVVRPTHLDTHDKAIDGVDFRALPENDASYDVVAYDPPYVCARHTSDTGIIERFGERYGLIDSPGNRKELVELICDGMTEAARVVKPHGFVLMKCQPFQNGKRDFVHMPSIAIAHAENIGLRLEDELVHARAPGPASTDVFHHARSAHSVMLVFCRRRLWRPGTKRAKVAS